MNRFKGVMSVVVALLAMAMPLSAVGAAKVDKVPPTMVGIAPEQLIQLYDSLLINDASELHHLMVMVDGKIVGELHPAPFRAEDRHTLYSVSKTFTAVAVGLAIDDGLLSVDDQLSKFYPEYKQYIEGVTIDDMLTMRSGFDTVTEMRNNETDWVDYYLSRPLVAVPGTRYSYDSIETYLLSSVVQKVTGRNILDLLQERVFGPMGITDVEWEKCPNGIVTGGWGIYISALSQLRFGQLLLQKGNWEGQQLVSQAWVEQMMSPHVLLEGNDYGYQMWLSEYPGAWRADGAYGQHIIIVPQKNMVVVLNQCCRAGVGKERRFIREKVVSTCLNYVIDASPKEIEKLRSYEAAATLPLLQGASDSASKSKFAGKRFALPENKLGWSAVSFGFTGDSVKIEITDSENKVTTLTTGYNEWHISQIAGYPHYSIEAQGRFSNLSGPFHSGSCYAWQQDGTLSVKLHYIDWITSLLLNFTIQHDGRLHIEVSENFSQSPFDIVSE